MSGLIGQELPLLQLGLEGLPSLGFASIVSAGPTVVVGATSVMVAVPLTEVFAVLVAVIVTLVGAG
jgi:hypothetical protein